MGEEMDPQKVDRILMKTHLYHCMTLVDLILDGRVTQGTGTCRDTIMGDVDRARTEVERLRKEGDKAYAAYHLEHSGRGVDAKAHTAEIEQVQKLATRCEAHQGEETDLCVCCQAVEVERLRRANEHWHQRVDQLMIDNDSYSEKVERLRADRQALMDSTGQTARIVMELGAKVKRLEPLAAELLENKGRLE